MSAKQFNIVGGLLIGLNFLATSCEATVRVPESTVPVQATSQEAQFPLPVPSTQVISKTQQTARRKTVADYFLEIPVQYRGMDSSLSISMEERLELLNRAEQGQNGGIYDPNNGYLKLIRKNNAACFTYTVVLFSRPSASPLVAINSSCDIGDMAIILDPDQNWRDVTTNVLPVDLSPSPSLNYIIAVNLPQIGRTIEVYHEDESHHRTLIGRYRFNGEQFVEQKRR